MSGTVQVMPGTVSKVVGNTSGSTCYNVMISQALRDISDFTWYLGYNVVS